MLQSGASCALRRFGGTAFLRLIFALTIGFLSALPVSVATAAASGCVPILLYHRFGAVAEGQMTVTTPVFNEQLRILREDGYRVISLRDLLADLRTSPGALPARSVVITSDDGHVSVYREMFPLIRQSQLPVTLFIYPSAISRASYAMTWAQLQEMKASGLVDIQSHTYWHPNFMIERRQLSPEAYSQFVTDQLLRSKHVLQQELDTGGIDLLAWPFGLYDAELIKAAKSAGYVAGVTIERRPVTAADDLMALPRYIVTNTDTGAAFRRLLTCPR